MANLLSNTTIGGYQSIHTGNIGSYAITSGNIGSQSVSYASNSGALNGWAYTSYAYRSNGNGYYQVNDWVQMNGNYGIFWPNNYGLHLYPNQSSYGALQINGSKNGWSGIYFYDSQTTLMMNSNESGHYRDGYGWQYRWYNGAFYITTAAQGGGTEYLALHTGNIGSYALTSLPSHNHDDRYYTESESDSRFIRKNTWEGNSYIGTGGDIYGTVFYDSNDTTYYVDPSSYASRLKGLAVGENYYNHTYPGIVQSGSTNYNYNWYNGSWSGSVTLGYLANCSDQWEFGIHDSGQRVVSAFLFDGGGNNKIVMGRDLGWGATYIEAASSFRAPIFYDSADTNYYLDANSTSRLYRVDAVGEMRAPIYYDSADTGYYLDPASSSNLRNIMVYPYASSWAEGIAFSMPSSSTWGGLRWRRERGNNDGNWYIGYTALDSTDDLVFGANNNGSQVNNIIRLTKSGTITLGGDTTINGVWQTNISTAGGWSKLSFTASNAWGDGTTYGVLGASGGNEPGVMVYNMHATWAGSSQGAGIRMGRSGGVAGGSWYQVATMDSDEFMIAKNGSWSNGGLKITSDGILRYANTGYRYIWENGTWGINISGNAATANSATTASSVPWSGITGKPSGSTGLMQYGDFVNQVTFAGKTTTFHPSVIKTLLWGGNGTRYTVTDSYTGTYPQSGSTWVRTYELIDGSNSVYSSGNIYCGFWNNNPPANITVRVQNTSGTWYGPYQGSNIGVGYFEYWRIPCGGPNFIKAWEITFTPQPGLGINLQTVDIVIDNSEGIDQTPLVGRAGSSMYGNLSFVGSGNTTNLTLNTSGVIVFPNTSNAGLSNSAGDAGFRLDDPYGNIYTWNTSGGYYVDANSYYFRSTGASNWMTINSGTVQASADFRAPIFYDSNDTNYYGDFAGTSRMSRVDAVSQMRSPIYYDSADTGYYIDPNGTSNIVRTYLTASGNDWYLNLNGLTLTTISTGETIWRNLSSFRFSDVNDWDYNSWAGLKFINSTKQIVLGVAGNVFTANSPQTGTLLLDRIATVYVNNTSQVVWHSGNFTDNSSNWNTAYSWGNHASAGYVTSSALSSYVPLSGTTLTEGNYFYFRSNMGAYLGATNSPSLQVYATGGNAAFMSFHRGGNYAVNFGLDSDNVMRIGGWSAAADRWVLDMSGNNTVAGSFRAPIFYDSNDTNYYGDFASTSVMNGIRFGTSTNNATLSGNSDWGIRLSTNVGYIQFGPANSSYAHIYTDRDTFYFNRDILINGYSVITSSNIGSQSVSYATTAGSVAWTNVSSRPTALSQFTNDSAFLSGASDVSINSLTLGRGAGNYSDNAAFGLYAVYANSTGRSLTGIGHRALQNNTTGNNNTALGSETLINNTTGSNNVGIGASAMTTLTTGGANVAVGTNAAYSMNGSYNVAIGQASLFQNTSNSNVSIGYYAGFTNIGGQNNIFIGYQAGYNETGSNKLYISNSNTYDPLIGGDFLNQRVTINLSPNNGDATLHILSSGTTSNSKSLIVNNNAGNYSLVVLDNGNVGCGTDQPVGQLNVFGGVDNNPGILTIQSQSGGGGNTGIYFRPYQNKTFANTAPAQATILAVDASYSAHLTFSTKTPGSGTNPLVERMRLSSTGNLLIGTTTNGSYQLDVTGTGRFTSSVTASNYITSSDQRLKDNITPIVNSLNKIKSITGVEFDWNSGSNQGTHDVGLIAQEVEVVLPEAVSTQDDGYKTLAYSKVIPLLVEAMKEQQAMIDALKAELELLKNK